MVKLKAAGRWLAKYVLPWLALLLAATTDAVGESLLGIPAWGASLILAGSGVLGQLGVLPWPVGPTLAKVFAYLSSGTSALLVAHATGKLGNPTDHAHLFAVFGAVGILMGVVGGRQGARALLGPPPLDAPPPSVPKG